MDISTLFFLSSGLFLGWTFGANNMSSVFGTAIGTRMLSFRTAAIIASILIVLGAFSLVLSIWPYYKPSIYEVRRVTWPTKKIMITNCLDVLVYSVSFAVFFFLVDILFAFIIKAL